MEDLKLATSAIALIIFLVIPGISFKQGYYIQRLERSLVSSSFQERLISTIFISILFQICIILLNNNFFETKISFQTYTAPLTEDFILGNNKVDFDRKTLWFVLKYLLLSTVFPFLTGFFFNKIICFFNLDLYIPYFRSKDYWYYYFRGNIPNNDRFRKKIKNVKITSTLVDVLVETPTDSKLYSGYYVIHTLKKSSNDIDTLILTDVLRYSTNQKKFVEVPGHYFKIKGDKIININTRYIDTKYIDKEKRKKKKTFDLSALLAVVFLLTIVLSFIIPFYLEGGIFKLILNIIILTMLSVFFTSFLYNILSKTQKTDLKSLLGFVIIIIILCLLFYFIN